MERARPKWPGFFLAGLAIAEPYNPADSWILKKQATRERRRRRGPLASRKAMGKNYL